MNTSLMPESHQPAAPWAWRLGAGEATTLAPAPVPRWLRVEAGRLWVTARDGGPEQPDLWLSAGDSLALPPGTAWVVEAWPAARASLLQAAPQRLSGLSDVAGWWRRVRPVPPAARCEPRAA